MHLTLASPRTGMRSRPRLRACAFTHSAVAARSLYISRASSVLMRWRHCATAVLSPALGWNWLPGAGGCWSSSWPWLFPLGSLAWGPRVQLAVRWQAPVDQPLFGRLAHALVHLLDHGRQLGHVAAGGDGVHAHDHLAGAVGGQLHVVGRAPAAVGHLHVAGIGICRAGTRLVDRLAIALLDCLQLG